MKTNIMGTAVATVQQMQSYIQKVNPAVPKSVIDMVEYYISEGKTEGVRGDIAFAQSCLETGNFTFNGSAVTLDQNNFAGIGVTKNGMKGNSFSHPWIGIRAQIQHLKAYASNEKLYGVCVDPRFCYVKREIAPYVEWLGIQENPQGGGWAAGKNYGSKILEILAKIIAMPEVNKEDVTMNLNTSLISNNNSYANQVPKYIVIHNTDNFAKGANAKAHAKAQHDGNFSGYSAHVYVDDTEAYQATPFNRGAWHVGVNYGGGLFGICNNHNSIGIEMCVQAGYNYDKAFRNTVEICKMLMQKFGIDADHVVSHYDVCAKNCPSAIRAKGDWNRFKQLIGAKAATTTVDKYYRIRKTWGDSKSQIGAYKSLENAKKEWKQGYTIYDWNGKAVYPEQKKDTSSSKAKVSLTEKLNIQLPVLQSGTEGSAVRCLQAILGVAVDGDFGKNTKTALKTFQKNIGIDDDDDDSENEAPEAAAAEDEIIIDGDDEKDEVIPETKEDTLDDLFGIAGEVHEDELIDDDDEDEVISEDDSSSQNDSADEEEDEDDEEDEISDDIHASDTVLDIFGTVTGVESIKSQLAKTFTKFEDPALDNMDLLAPYDINFVVTGYDMSVKSQIAIGIAKALNTYGICDKNKLVRATAQDLNGRDFSMIFEKLKGGCLIIDGADMLDDKAAGIIVDFVQQDNQDVAIVLEGEEDKIKELFRKYPVLHSKFLNIIHIGKYNENELVQLAEGYAKKKGYEISGPGAASLKTLLRERMQDGYSVDYEDIMAIIEEAIASLEKRNMKNLFMTVLDNKYEEAAMFMLQPEDFKNINIPD